MALNVRIREASLDDNEGLIELIRLCPMQGHIQMYLDRYPNYFAMTRLQGERSFVYVAEDLQRNLIGSVVLLERLEWWNGGWRKVLHIGDMRTAPAWRGSRVAAEFIEIYRQKLLGGPYDLGFAEIMDGNLAPIKAQKLLGEQLAVNYEGPVNLYQLLPLKTYRVTDHYSYRRAEPKDLAAIARLLAATYAQSPGSPPFTVQYLEKMTHQHASFGISHIWLAENGEGRLLACLATWDQKNLRRTVAVKLSPSLRLLVKLLGWLGRLWNLPPNPEEGRALRYLYFRWIACQRAEIRALQHLVRHVMTDLKQLNEYQFVVLGFHRDEPLQRCLRGILRVKTKIHLYSHRKLLTQDSQVLAQPQAAPYFDSALL